MRNRTSALALALALAVSLVGCRSDRLTCDQLASRLDYRQGRTPSSARRECEAAAWSDEMRRCVANAADHAAIRACGDRLGEQVAKPKEALVQLPRIASGALAAWKRTGSVPQASIPATPSTSCCLQNNGSQPCAARPAQWSAWRPLDFEITEPYRLQYAYTATGPDAFEVTAIGDYDCDLIATTHVLHGRIVEGALQIDIDEPTNDD